MLLEKVIVENIRSHKYFKLEPQLQGITAINGENGAGKSTLLDSFAWSLFGSRVNGQKNKDLIREGVNPSETPVRVTSFIIVGNRKYKIERTINNLNGNVSCRVYSKSLDNDSLEWTFESGPAVKHAETYIRKMLNTDEKGFLSSIFIQQKQVDQIVTSSPVERGQVIESLIGVSSITEALNLGRENSRGLQKAASIIQPGSLDDEYKKVENQGFIVTSLKNQITVTELEFNRVLKELTSQKEAYEKESKKQEELDALNNSLEREKDKYKLINSQLENQIKLIEENKLKKGRKISVTSVQEDYNKALQENTLLQKEFFNLQQKITNYEKIFLIRYDSKILKEEKEDLEKLIKEKEILLDSINEEIYSLKAKVKSTKEFIELLKKGEGICSLCGQEIKNPEEELEKHKTEQELFKNKAKELNNKFKVIKDELVELKNSLLEKENNYKMAMEKDNSIEDFEISKKSFVKLKTKLAANKEELDILNKKLVSAKVEEDKQNLLISAKKQIKDTEEQLKNSKSIIEDLLIKIEKSPAISKSEFKEQTNNLALIQSNFDKLNSQLSESKHKLELGKERGKTIYAEYLRCKQANEDYKELTEQLSVFNLSNEVLTKFKKERIKTSIPELTKIASEIFYKFTEGKFIEIRLNEKFEAFAVTANQTVRPIGLLSGGELSAAAIALRLAIALFLTNEEESLLILDEVLVSMSEERSQTILETIASLTKSQIIFIAHNVSINQFADKVIQL